VRQIADGARASLKACLGSVKTFTVDSVNQEALNFYVWDSEEAAKAFFSPQLIELSCMASDLPYNLLM